MPLLMMDKHLITIRFFNQPKENDTKVKVSKKNQVR